MDEDKHFNRVRESAETAVRILATPSNAPLDDYFRLEDAIALASAMSIDPADMTVEDLERLLLIRDGFYELVKDANDKGSEGEHSIDLAINALSRLYVDLERLIKIKHPAVKQAIEKIDALQNTPIANIDSQSSVVRQVRTEANAVISQTSITNRTININIMNFELSKMEVFRNLKIDINRLSASVFAIKMQFEAGVVFQGTIKFLNEGVDRILKDIRQFAEQLSNFYKNSKELLTAIAPVLEKGTRFVKLIGGIITGFFDGSQVDDLPEFKFVARPGHKARAIMSAAALDGDQVVFGGRDGQLITVNVLTGQVVHQAAQIRSDIRCIASLGNGDIAVGTEDGLAIIGALTNKRAIRASYSERVDALAIANWGGLGSAIVTGAGDGSLRRWSLSGGLSQFRDKVINREFGEKLGRSTQTIIRWHENVLAAVAERLFVLNQNFEVELEVRVDLKILSMCAFTDETVVVVGTGFIAEVNLAKGTYTRMLSVSHTAEYVAVALLVDGVIAVGTAHGVIRAIDVRSGTELGEVNVDMTLRGLVISGQRLYAYGGGWKNTGKALVPVVWEKLDRLPG